MPYIITPLKIGEYQQFEKSRFTYDKHHGQKIDVALITWLVRGDTHCILVDSGPPIHASQGDRHHLKMVVREDGLAGALREQSVKPDDIDTVILTHLHWDHAYNLELFPHARIYVQKRELEYAVNPLPLHRITYEVNFTDVVPYWANHLGRYSVLDGNAEICEGIQVLLLPGHTPGLQGVLVDTKQDKYLIASDCFPLFENIEQDIPNGIHADLTDWYASLATVKNLRAAILPGHDPAVFKKKEYGSDR